MTVVEKLKAVRKASGYGLKACKDALIKTRWNVEYAIEYLRINKVPYMTPLPIEDRMLRMFDELYPGKGESRYIRFNDFGYPLCVLVDHDDGTTSEYYKVDLLFEYVTKNW